MVFSEKKMKYSSAITYLVRIPDLLAVSTLALNILFRSVKGHTSYYDSDVESEWSASSSAVTGTGQHSWVCGHDITLQSAHLRSQTSGLTCKQISIHPTHYTWQIRITCKWQVIKRTVFANNRLQVFELITINWPELVVSTQHCTDSNQLPPKITALLTALAW